MATGQVFTNFNLAEDVVTSVRTTLTESLWATDEGIADVFYTTATSGSNYYLNCYTIDPTSNTLAIPDFAIVYGNRLGNNSKDGKANNATTGEYNVASSNYAQYRNLLNLDEYFEFNGVTTDEVYLINFYRSQLKQQLDTNWNLVIGSTSLSLVADTSDPTVTIGGTYYNIVSGSTDTIYTSGGEYVHYGRMYPEHGLLVLDGEAINTYLSITPSTNMDGEFLDQMNLGQSFLARNKQKISSAIYFVRIKNAESNFSNNPSFQSGSYGDFKHEEMYQNPEVYPTTIGLYNDSNELMAVAKLSTPIKKNYESEKLIRVKLQF